MKPELQVICKMIFASKFVHFQLLVFISIASVQALGEDNWRSFQNGGELAKATDKVKLPTTWSPDKGIKWSLDLEGYGQSSPVLNGSLIYLTTVTGEMKDNFHLLAIDRETGKVSWKKSFKNSSPEKSSSYVSRAAPTPVCDENGVIAFFEGGNLVALSPKGDPRWDLDLVEKHGPIKARHGLASSLEQNEKHVFVWIEREKDPYLLCIEKETGNVVWKSEGLGTTTWSSPRLIPVPGGDHLVLSGIGKIAGYDPASGKQLWDFAEISGNSTPTPVPVGDGKFLIGASTGRGEESSGKASLSNGLIQIEKKDGDYSARFVWQAETATSTFGSPLAHNGHAYFVNRSGVLFCLDLNTGKQVYAGRTKSSIWATPIGVGNLVYLFGKDGTTTIVEAGKTFNKTSTNTLWKSSPPSGAAGGAGGFGGPVLYSGVVAGDQLLLRRGDRLFCIDKE